MKKKFTWFVIFAIISNNAVIAQSNDADKLQIAVGGSFAKPKIIPKLEKFAIAQVTVNYKLTSTAKTIGKDNTTKAIAGAKFSAYLETTDGELTDQDFQEITNHFYSYFQKKLKENNIDTVSWDAITATDFYKDGNEKVDKKKEKSENVWVTSTANHGNILYGGGVAFAFGKIKKASRFCDEIGAPAGFFHLNVDFADLFVNLKMNTTETENMFYSKSVQKKEYKWAVKPQLKVTPSPDYLQSNTLLWNEKSQSESLIVKGDIDGKAVYADDVSEDESKLKNSLFAFRKEMTPVVIETTREKYKAAAKEALEKYADAFVAKCLAMKKD